MALLKRYAIILFISFLIFLIILSIFNPIFTAKNLIFPYSISKFDIIVKYPNYWFYIKLIYCISCFFNLILFVNSGYKYFQFKTSKIKSKIKLEEKNDLGKFNLLLGNDSVSKKNIVISEKGLYQNLLITGTIGSRKNRFMHVSFFTSVFKI